MLDQLDLQCDVGGVFDSKKKRFDHHQRTFEHHWWSEADAIAKAEKSSEKINDKKPVTKLSSAGLIYKFYGHEIIKNTCKLEYNIDLTE
jgi:uncharacterized UPF0160 family protein